MSWLSELFSGGGGEDPLAVRQREEQALRDQQAREAAAQQQQQMYYDQLLQTQQAQSAQEAKDRASAQALQEKQYNDQLEFLKQSMAPTALDTSLQEQQLAQIQRDAERDTLRSGALGQVNSLFAPEFERSLVPGTYDDPYINEAYAGQRGKADEYLNNLLKRGVITQSGYTGGQADIEEQGAGVRSQLGDLGNTLLEAQRGQLTDVANRARNTASTLDIGQAFDPNVYADELGQIGTDFGASFGDKFKAGIPGDLFDLSSLQQKAGAAQGAQNLAFDPNAVAGLGNTDEETEPLPKKRRPTAVF